MGLLGRYYDQAREGKGVSKSDRTDKGLFNFFDVYTTNFWKLTLLSLMYILFCIPVVTAPAATCAFVYIIRNMVRKKPVFLWSDFVDIFTHYFWKGLLLGIVDVLVFGIVGYAVYFYGGLGGLFPMYSGAYWGYVESPSIFNLILCGLAFVCLVFYSFMRYYTYMMLVSFEYSFKQIYKNAFYLSNLGFFRNILITLIRIVIVVLLWYISSLGNTVGLGLVIVLIPIIVIPFRGYVINYNSFAVIYKHIVGPYEAEQHELKKNESEEEEAVFTDMGKNSERK